MEENDSITIRLDSKNKEQFKKICQFDETNISEKIKEFIKIQNRRSIETIEEKYNYLLKYKTEGDDIEIVDSPSFFWNIKENRMEKTGDLSVPTVSIEDFLNNNKNIKSCTTSVYSKDLKDFLEENKGKKILLYLKGCDFKNNWIRSSILDN